MGEEPGKGLATSEVSVINEYKWNMHEMLLESQGSYLKWTEGQKKLSEADVGLKFQRRE